MHKHSNCPLTYPISVYQMSDQWVKHSEESAVNCPSAFYPGFSPFPAPRHKPWILKATHAAVFLHRSILFLLGAPLDEGEWASNLHDSHYDRELGTEAATLSASKVLGRIWLESRQPIFPFLCTVYLCCYVKTSWQSWYLTLRLVRYHLFVLC